MFTYGLEQFVEFYLWDREREVRALSTTHRARGERHWWISIRAAVDAGAAYARRLFAGLGRAPRVRA